jgi:ankyrin repeat protein
MQAETDVVDRFIAEAVVPRSGSHASGTLAAAEQIRAAHPEVDRASIHTAAILGDEASVARFLSEDAGAATAIGGPYGWDPLTHLCFSRYLKLDSARSPGFVAAATRLLDGGASANTGWTEPDHRPHPEWEPVLYGAAGIAHHPELTRLLLSRGADPNDDEVAYHAPETYDNRAVEALVESGRLTPDSLAMMLIRKHDWHDQDGVEYLLEHGADPNLDKRWGMAAIHHAIARDNALPTIQLLLDHGADPTRVAPRDQTTAVELAARRGRGDVLAAIERRGLSIALEGVDRLIAACARGDGARARAIAASEPELVRELLARGGTLLAEFAGTANTAGAGLLLELGVPVEARYRGDGYWDIAPNSTALHVAAWKAWHDTVAFFIARGAPLDLRDAQGRTPLMLAVKACVDSYWSYRRSPASVAALLQAGASTTGVQYPAGYDEVDQLLKPLLG